MNWYGGVLPREYLWTDSRLSPSDGGVKTVDRLLGINVYNVWKIFKKKFWWGEIKQAERNRGILANQRIMLKTTVNRIDGINIYIGRYYHLVIIVKEPSGLLCQSICVSPPPHSTAFTNSLSLSASSSFSLTLDSVSPCENVMVLEYCLRYLYIILGLLLHFPNSAATPWTTLLLSLRDEMVNLM